MTHPRRSLRTGVSVVVLRDDAVLLVERGRAPAAGLWAPPGGAVEPGESLVAAAMREVVEETGVTVELIGPCARWEIVSSVRDGEEVDWVLHVFAALWRGGEPRAGDDAAEARFVPMSALAELALVAGVDEAIAAARRLRDGSPPPEALRNA